MKKLFFYTTLALFFSACNKEEKQNYSNIAIYGHGGAGFESHTNRLPANSFKSIQKAIEVLNADGVEVDLQIDSNGTTWLFHDQFLEGKTSGNDCFGERSTSYIKTCNYNLGGKIFQLQELMDYFSSLSPKPKVSLQVELLDRCIDHSLLIEQLIAIMEVNNAYDWVQIESDSPGLLIQLKAASKHFQTFIRAPDLTSCINLCSENGFDGIIMNNTDVSVKDVERVQALGFKIALFGVASQAEIKSALKKHPNQIQCDNIELLHRIMKQ